MGPPAAAPASERVEPWQDPLARWALGALLERYCCVGPAPGAVEGPSEADAARWARRFAADSFGDALLAAAMAALLRNVVAAAVQVGALHAHGVHFWTRASACVHVSVDRMHLGVLTVLSGPQCSSHSGSAELVSAWNTLWLCLRACWSVNPPTGRQVIMHLYSPCSLAVQRTHNGMCVQASLLRALDDDMAVHLLPPLYLAPGGPSAYLPSPNFAATAEALPAAGAGACAHTDLSAGIGAEPVRLPKQMPAPGAAVTWGAADGAEAEMGAGGGPGADRVPNPALVELARLAACGRLQRAAEAHSMVPDLALARLLPLLAPGAHWPLQSGLLSTGALLHSVACLRHCF